MNWFKKRKIQAMASITASIFSLRAFRELVRGLWDPDAEVRTETIWSLHGLLTRLHVEDREVFRIALLAMREMGVVHHLLALLRDRSSPQPANQSDRVAELLGTIGDSEVVPDLIEFLEEDKPDPLPGKWDTGPSERVAAIWALAEIGDESALGPLIKATTSSSTDVRRAAAAAIGAFGNDQSVSVLSEMVLHDTDESTRVNAMESLSSIEAPQGLGIAIKSLQSDDSDEVRFEAAKAILGTRNALPAKNALLQALHDPDFQVRSIVITALGKLPADPVVIDKILAILDGESDYEKRVAVEALGELKASKAAPKLLGILRNPILEEGPRERGNVHLRLAAAHALGAISDTTVLPDLQEIQTEQASLVEGGGIYGELYERQLVTAIADAIAVLKKAVGDAGGDSR